MERFVEERILKKGWSMTMQGLQSFVCFSWSHLSLFVLIVVLERFLMWFLARASDSEDALSFTCDVLTDILCTIWQSVAAMAMLFTLFPLTGILFTFWAFVDAMAIPFTLHPLTDILCTIWPSVAAMAMRLILRPLTDILCTIWPSVGAMAMLLILHQLTDILLTIWRSEGTMATITRVSKFLAFNHDLECFKRSYRKKFHLLFFSFLFY